MAYLKLKSENEKFSFLIKKNPNNEKTPLLIKKNRQGLLVGTYKKDDHQCYGIWFKEGKGKNSYGKNDEFSYQNPQQYNSPLFILNAISTYLSNPLKKELEEDVISKQEIILGMVRCPASGIKMLDTLAKYFNGEFNIQYTEISAKNFQVSISSETTLNKLLHFTNLVAIMLVVRDNNSYLDTEGLEKYINSINVLNAPYFVRYIFKTNWLRKIKDYKKYKELLETDSISLDFGNTALMRRDVIKNMIDYSRPILDVGCGEGFYLSELAPKLERSQYYGIDIDPEELRKVKNKIATKEISNVELFPSLKNFKESKNINGDIDILFIEVMEHMPLEDAKNLLKEILEIPNINSLIITTPNRDFNSEYFFEENQMRHHDHHYEMDKPEFIQFVEEMVCSKKFKYEYFEMGDMVSGRAPSQGVKVVKNEN